MQPATTATCFKTTRICVTALMFVAVLTANASISVQAGHSVYFPHIVEKLSLDAATRAAANRIMNKSERDVLAVFAKHGISPKAKPDFGKLMGARHELQAVEKHERAQLVKILTPAQLKIYDKMIQYTRAQVIKATRHDN